jgi:dipeptidyl aminopeptidase/acylaminoacyl peptidase
MHGKNDQVIPIQDSRDLYKQAQSYSISSELIELENIGHNDIKRGMKS